MNIVFITYTRFPNASATALRLYILGKLFKACNYEVFFIGMGNDLYENASIRQFREFNYVSLRLTHNNLILKIQNFLGFKSRLKNTLNKLSIKPDIILESGVPLNALVYLKCFAKKQNIKLIHDSIDWYSASQFKFHFLNLSYISNLIVNRYLIDKQFNIIAISTFLESHFKNKGITTVRIPFILDLNEINFVKSTKNDKIVIIYAGLPRKKDYLLPILNGLALLTMEQLAKLEFRVFGATLQDIHKLLRNNEDRFHKIQGSINAFGHVNRDCVIKNYEEADFSILLRSPYKRYAKAGFPTKIVESLSTGTPVILNITSDLGYYIRDNIEGIVISNPTDLYCFKAISKALTLSFIDRKKMYLNARKCAIENFHFEHYIPVLNKIVTRKLID